MRTFARLTLLATAALVVSACGTIDDKDVAARVDDQELTVDQLSSIAREQLGDDEAVRADMPTVLTILNNWVLDRVLRADLEASGNPLPEVEGELTDESLNASITESFNVWQQTTATPLPDDVVQAQYELGPVESNMICSAHILVADESVAEEVLDRLDEGESFVDMAAEYSIDGSAASGGNLGCSTAADFTAQFIPEFVDAALAADVGTPVGPVASQFGYHIILLRPFDDLAPGELDPVLSAPQARFEVATSNVDIYVDPRYGTFDGSSGVVPLG